MAFQPGAIVRVKSGGPELTVLSTDDDVATCLFFSDELGEFKEASLPLIAIELANLSDEDGPNDEEEAEDDEDENEDEDDAPAHSKRKAA